MPRRSVEVSRQTLMGKLRSACFKRGGRSLLYPIYRSVLSLIGYARAKSFSCARQQRASTSNIDSELRLALEWWLQVDFASFGLRSM